MMPDVKVVQSLDLPNGLVLEILDLSRQVAGDRWQVKVEVRVAVPVKPDFLPGLPAEECAALRAALGPEVIFSQIQERNFIDATERQTVLQKFVTDITAIGLRYCSHPEFPTRFLRKKFAEYRERQQWR
jgi:hypothetical protein